MMKGRCVSMNVDDKLVRMILKYFTGYYGTKEEQERLKEIL